MKIAILKIFLFILGINAWETLLPPKETCYANMFNMTLRGFSITGLEISLFYSIQSNRTTLQDFVDNKSVTANQIFLLKNCLELILFRVTKLETGFSFTETYELTKTDWQNYAHSFSILNYQVKSRLDPYSTYSIEVGYRQNEPRSKVTYCFKYETQICFDSPNALSYSTRSFANGSYLIEWTEPSVVNAPRVCYYELGIVYESGGERVFRTEERRYFRANESKCFRLHESTFRVFEFRQ
jgi:hypothetical protein